RRRPGVYARRPEPRPLDRLYRCRSGDQRSGPVQLQPLRLPQPAAGPHFLRPPADHVLTDEHTFMLTYITSGSVIRRGVLAASAMLAAGLLAGCDPDRIIEVEDPDRLPPDFLGDSSSLPVVRAGVVRDFIVAYSGTDAQEGQILQAGLLADEMHSSGTFPTRQEVDRRATTVDNGTNADVFRELSRARRSAERGDSLFRQFNGLDSERAELLALAGFTYIYFGENYCTGVPFSEFNEATDQFEFGTPLSTSEIFERALERFDEALPIASEDERVLNLIRVGRGRALVNLGRFDEAAAAV